MAKKSGGTRKRSVKGRKRSSQKRTLLRRSRNNVAFAKRGAKGRFKEIDGVKRSLAADRRKRARTKKKKGYGDQGDQ